MKRTIDVQPTVKELAEAFCGLRAELQVDFLVEVERIMQGWGSYAHNTQLQAIGAELRAADGFAAKLVRDVHAELVREPPEKTLDEVLRTAKWPVAGKMPAPCAKDGARCHRCGHYETDYDRASSLYAHCPSCSQHTRWERVKADASLSEQRGAGTMKDFDLGFAAGIRAAARLVDERADRHPMQATVYELVDTMDAILKLLDEKATQPSSTGEETKR